VAAGVLLATGCGSSTVDALPPPAEPARAPQLTEPPAGRVVKVGNQPQGIVADPRSGRVAVGLRDPDELALLDRDSGRALDRLALPGPPRHLAFDDSTGTVLVPAERAGRLARVRIAAGRRLEPVRVGAFPHDAAVAGERTFVGDQRGSTLSVVERGRRLRELAVAAQPGGLASLRDGTQVAVVSVRERAVELFDARTLRRLGRVGAGVGPTHVVSEPRFHRLYVTDTSAGALLVFDTVPRLELVRRVHLPGSPYGIALDGERHRLWVTLTAVNQVVELPAHGRPHVLRRFTTPRQPDTVAVDEETGRVFVTGRHAGVVQLLDP
jgi:DNA-binding beta-propeller fold protein YncE